MLGPPLYKLNDSSILSNSMGQSVVILGTYWGTRKTCMWRTSFGTWGVCWGKSCWEHIGHMVGKKKPPKENNLCYLFDEWL